jgi:hypothetical protein
MDAMKRRTLSVLLLAIGASLASARASGQGGTIDFVIRVTPSSGIEEPVRGFPLYLLSKSFQEITLDAEAAVPKPDMDKFIDKQEGSKELKAWMKKNQMVSLSGEEFIHALKPEDVMAVPEFYKAYMDRNADDQSAIFPKPKYKASDKTKDPAKYEKLDQQYQEAILHFMQERPETIDGIDLGLQDVNPGPKWQDLEGKRVPEVKRLTLDWAEGKYLVARSQTDLEGQGAFRGIAPGIYWLSSLDVPADVGDVRAKWDVAVAVAAGRTTSATLSNVNAVPLPHPAP